MNTNSDGIIFGGDVGFGECKGAYIAGDQLKTISFRSIVERTSDVDLTSGAFSKPNIIRVCVDGKSYDVGYEAAGGANHVPVLNRGYIETPQHKALRLALLASQPHDHIDVLVTGLPVTHFKHQHDRLLQLFKGSHQVSQGRTITVDEVHVIPQPLGGALSYLFHERESVAVSEMTLLVIDVGQYTTDWLTVRQRRALPDRSSSVALGASAVLEGVHQELMKSHGGAPDVFYLAEAMKAQKVQVFASGKAVDFQPLLRKHASEVAGRVATAIRNNLVELGDIDRIVLVGGGAKLFEPEFREQLAGQRFLHVSTEPGFANVRGYVDFGVIAMNRRLRRAG